ncbi:MAG TPA: hypothetical protein PKC30_08610 [Saprospiraceae bacterium]|nr:hypothetical protein [Saprospiraceae bacterium]
MVFDLIQPCYQPKEQKQDSSRTESDGIPSVGTFSHQQNCRTATSQNNWLDQLLRQVPNERNAQGI